MYTDTTQHMYVVSVVPAELHPAAGAGETLRLFFSGAEPLVISDDGGGEGNFLGIYNIDRLNFREIWGRGTADPTTMTGRFSA